MSDPERNNSQKPYTALLPNETQPNSPTERYSAIDHSNRSNPPKLDDTESQQSSKALHGDRLSTSLKSRLIKQIELGLEINLNFTDLNNEQLTHFLLELRALTYLIFIGAFPSLPKFEIVDLALSIIDQVNYSPTNPFKPIYLKRHFNLDMQRYVFHCNPNTKYSQRVAQTIADACDEVIYSYYQKPIYDWTGDYFLLLSDGDFNTAIGEKIQIADEFVQELQKIAANEKNERIVQKAAQTILKYVIKTPIELEQRINLLPLIRPVNLAADVIYKALYLPSAIAS